MSLRDRFYTPRTAKAILSPWRIALGVVVAVGLALLGVNLVLAILAGLFVYVVSVLVSMPAGPSTPLIDPFAVGEPWRHHVQGAIKARRRFDEALRSASGAQRQRLSEIGEQTGRNLARFEIFLSNGARGQTVPPIVAIDLIDRCESFIDRRKRE